MDGVRWGMRAFKIGAATGLQAAHPVHHRVAVLSNQPECARGCPVQQCRYHTLCTSIVDSILDDEVPVPHAALPLSGLRLSRVDIKGYG